ncbi:hypothetical protein, partial [Paraburkholderia sabiae]
MFFHSNCRFVETLTTTMQRPMDLAASHIATLSVLWFARERLDRKRRISAVSAPGSDVRVLFSV